MDLIPGLPTDLALDCLIRIPHHYLSSLASVCRNWKKQIHLPEFWRRRRASGFTRRVIVMSQSRVDPTRKPASEKCAGVPFFRLTLCEPETGLWAELPPGPGFSNGLPMYCQLAGVGSELVVMGGWDPVTLEVSSGVYVYSFVSATWRRGADMPGCRRSFFACASDSDRTVFVAGGHDGEKCALRSAMAYDVVRDEWALLPDMARERDECKAVFHRGRFHVIGGYPTERQGGFGGSAEWFDWGAWRWGPVQEDFLDSVCCPRSCIGEGDGEIVFCRGGDVAGWEGGTWRAAAELPRGARKTAYVTAWRGKVLVIGSEECGGAHKAYVLDLEKRKWERVESEEGFWGYVQSGCCLEV